MAIANLGLLGSVTAVSAGSQLLVANTTGAVIPSGTVIHITGTWDNIASVTAPTITCTSIHGTAATNHATAIGSGVTTTAGAGIWHQCFRMVTIDDIVNGGTIAVLDSNQLAVKRAAHAQGWSGALDTLRGTVATGTSTTGSPSVATAGTALVAGDLVVGSVSFENSAQMTADADTLNGSWSAIVGTFTTGGAAGTNVGTGSQGKIVTAPGAQTFNPTGGVADSVACVYSLIPVPPPAPTSTLPVFTNPAWTVVPPATATANVVTGAFPGGFVTPVAQVRTTVQTWILDSLSVRLLGLPTGVTSSERVFVGVFSQRSPSDTGIVIGWFGDSTTGYLDVNRVAAGVSTRIGVTPSWTSAIPYLRIRLAGPTVFIERSADAVTWTSHGSMDHGLDLSRCQVVYEITGTSAATPTIDQLNVNLTPPIRFQRVLSYYQAAVQRSSNY